MSNYELKQKFYDGLGQQDRYLLDAASNSTFMQKYEDEAMEFIETVAENSHYNAVKPFERSVMPKGHMILAKLAEMGMLLERIARVSLQEVSPYTNCSRFNHVELDFSMMAIQGQGMFR